MSRSADDDGETPLHAAGGAEVASLLAGAAGGVNAASGAGETPIFNAVRRGDAELVARLLELGADADATAGGAAGAAGAAGGGVTPLRLAVVSESAEVARLLLDAGADPNGGGPDAPDGDRPLDLTSDLEMVGLLLSAGARPGGRTDP